MTRRKSAGPEPSQVAMWHKLSGLPDNVTDEGVVVDGPAGRREQAEKDALRSDIQRLRQAAESSRARGLANLAGSYLLAGDVETARRYLGAAREVLEDARKRSDEGHRPD